MSFEYTVSNKDRGLTYIFLEEAKKQQGFDSSKKIDWHKVMSVFDEIQKEEESEGQKLFSGGTDKTRAGWGSSYMIKSGDKISLSDEQMNKIYGAMGLTITNSQTPPSTPKIPTQDKTPPTADKTPPQQSTPPTADKTPPTSGEDLRNNKPSFLNPLLVQRKEYAGQEVLNKDGTTSIYDDDGYVESVQDKDGNKTREISRNSDGSVNYYWDYEYDKDGNNTREIVRNPDGSVNYYWDYEYDKDGNKTREISRNPDGSVNYYWDYEYDKDGNKTREISRNPDGSVYSYWDYEYDKDGNKTRMISRNPDGSVNSYWDYEYDKDGNKTREIRRNPDGSVDSYYDYEYDKDGNRTMIRRNPDGSEIK